MNIEIYEESSCYDDLINSFQLGAKIELTEIQKYILTYHAEQLVYKSLRRFHSKIEDAFKETSIQFKKPNK